VFKDEFHTKPPGISLHIRQVQNANEYGTEAALFEKSNRRKIKRKIKHKASVDFELVPNSVWNQK
jgi:hypothetical protein